MTREELFRKNQQLSTEFELYILEHPEIEEKIPGNAMRETFVTIGTSSYILETFSIFTIISYPLYFVIRASVPRGNNVIATMIILRAAITSSGLFAISVNIRTGSISYAVF